MFRGSIVALVTPMHTGGTVDFDALERLVEFHIEQGTQAIVAVGTTGESATLTVPEHGSVIRRTVELVAGRVPVIGGTGANATAEAIELTVAAKGAGVDGCLLVTPYYNKPTQEGLFLHHSAVADAVTIPQIVYNVPGRTACDLLTQTMVRLAEHPNIVGLKDATGDLERGRALIEQCGDKIDLLSGDDETALDLMLDGFAGVISVTSNVAPGAMRAVCDAALACDRAKARSLNQPLEALHRDLFVESNPIPAKWVLERMGLIEGGIRLPLTPLSAEFHPRLNEAMNRANINDCS
jgi:4-hydroxy-tetrahydrodipicolinate synthase